MVFNTINPQPNICTNRVLVDYRTNSDSINELKRMGISVYKSTSVKSLYKEVNGHPDMQIHFINNKAICASEVYDYYKSLNLHGIDLISGSMNLKSKYPDDVAFYVCAMCI